MRVRCACTAFSVCFQTKKISKEKRMMSDGSENRRKSLRPFGDTGWTESYSSVG